MTKRQHGLSRYTPEIAEEICRRLAGGESLRAICRGDEFPSEATIRNWHINNVHEFSAQYTQAREAQMDRFADEILEIADDGSNDWMERKGGENPGWELNGEHTRRSLMRIEARKWLMSKIAPKRFGDKIQVENTNGPSWYIEGVAKEISSESWERTAQLAIAKPEGNAD